MHEIFPHAWRWTAVSSIPARRRGHGVDIDEEEAAKHPYKRAYLPVNALEDGTLWHW